jgi:hypothetical protein
MLEPSHEAAVSFCRTAWRSAVQPAPVRRVVERAVSFGQWLRQRRRALGLTHAMLAQRSHCSVSTLRKI